LVNRMENCQSYTAKRTLICATFVRNHSLVGMIYQGIQVQITKNKYHVVKRVSHRSHISLVQWDDPDVANGLFRAMYVRKVSIVAMICTVTSEYILENDPFLVKCVKNGSLIALT
jgi:hypothetical protein